MVAGETPKPSKILKAGQVVTVAQGSKFCKARKKSICGASFEQMFCVISGGDGSVALVTGNQPFEGNSTDSYMYMRDDQ